MSAEQPVERAATLEDVRAEVLAPDRLNALVFGGFALVALTIAIVGVAGVLAFSVSARTREFGIRLAIGSEPRHLLARVLGEGAVIAAAGIIAGALGGIALTRVASGLFGVVRMPGVLPIAGAATLPTQSCLPVAWRPRAARAPRGRCGGGTRPQPPPARVSAPAPGARATAAPAPRPGPRHRTARRGGGRAARREKSAQIGHRLRMVGHRTPIPLSYHAVPVIFSGRAWSQTVSADRRRRAHGREM